MKINLNIFHLIEQSLDEYRFKFQNKLNYNNSLNKFYQKNESIENNISNYSFSNEHSERFLGNISLIYCYFYLNNIFYLFIYLFKIIILYILKNIHFI